MKIILASDHAGFKLKEALKQFLESKGYACEDAGPHAYKLDDDYPDFIIPAAEKVAKAKSANVKGIVIGGSGEGEAIAANKVKGIRAVTFYGGPEKIITLSREHNNTNILSFGARFVTPTVAKRLTLLWLKTKPSDHKRHKRRLAKIAKYEKEQEIKKTKR